MSTCSLDVLSSANSASDVNSGMDAAQMDESLYEAQWEGEEDYKPLPNGNIHLD